ncbi:hypothetical protein DFP72DRAFT_870592 [Ephemerocybe angulata]|uniref:Uncharacterized protein n=1 Tax=Ephemerocybe angulata TaxID=980116 RepID=A0A8H6MHF4_9AGAR|nr:hypothetical protein DFP72DRAFT_870592 [Tulosesus angulatus]
MTADSFLNIMVTMPPVLLSRSIDTILGIGTGFFAYYLHETHPRTAPRPEDRLLELVKWKYAKYQTMKQDLTE